MMPVSPYNALGKPSECQPPATHLIGYVHGDSSKAEFRVVTYLTIPANTQRITDNLDLFDQTTWFQIHMHAMATRNSQGGVSSTMFASCPWWGCKEIKEDQ